MSDLNALDLEPGEIVGGYTLISRLGGGAMGSVWRVRDDGGQIYAMKILRDSLKDDSETDEQNYQNTEMSSDGNPGDYGNADAYNGNDADADNTTHHHSRDPHVTARERMRREAVAMRKVHHPGVCAIVDMELDDSLAFIVTELIEGKNLRDDVAANGRYVGNDLQRLASKLIDAVRAVHAQGIIHRDIKPTNVMISASGPVLVDFGIAMTEGESHVTRTGLVMGTPGFIAPEIIDGAESNEATDWWSLASVIAFAATGRPVFGSKPMMAVLEREASGNANLAGLPPNTVEALRSALNPDPAKRCSPDQLLQAITLDALNPFESGELDDEDNGNIQGVVPPFGQTPQPDSAPPDRAASNPRTAWTDDVVPTSEAPVDTDQSENDDLATEPMTPQSRQLRGSTRAMPLVSNSATAAIAQSPEPTSALPAANLRAAEQGEDGTMPLTVAPEAQTQQASLGQQMQPAPYAPYPYDQNAQPNVPLQPPAPPMNPASVRRDKLISRSTLLLWLAAIPLALLSAAAPMVSICCAAALLWLLLAVGYSEEAQLEREAKHGGVRKRGDIFLRLASLPWHILKALVFTIPRTLIMALIASVGPVVVSLVSGLPTRMVELTIGSWHIPLPLSADLSLSYSSLLLAIFMAAAWIIAVFGPKTTLLDIGAGKLRGSKPKSGTGSDAATNRATAATVPSPNGEYGGSQISEPNDEEDTDTKETVKSKRHSTWHWILLITWLIVTVAALTLILTNHQIDWIPLPNPQL